jgi:flagellar assembly protein FliH
MSSKIIRGSSSPTTEDWLVVSNDFSLTELSHGDSQAREERAHEEAMQQHTRRIAQLEQQLREVEGQIPQRIEQARQAGLREGEAAGHARAMATVDAAIQKLARAAAEVSGFRAAFRRESEQELVKLSLAIARKVLRRELTVDPSALQGVIKAALESLNASEIHRIRLAAPDAAVLERHLLAMGLPQAIEVCPDATLERGAVLFETVRGLVDAGIQTQLGEIERGFADLADAR